MKENFFKRLFSIMLAVSISSTMAFSASAVSYYVGTNKGGSQTGISA